MFSGSELFTNRPGFLRRRHAGNAGTDRHDVAPGEQRGDDGIRTVLQRHRQGKMALRVDRDGGRCSVVEGDLDMPTGLDRERGDPALDEERRRRDEVRGLIEDRRGRDNAAGVAQRNVDRPRCRHDVGDERPGIPGDRGEASRGPHGDRSGSTEQERPAEQRDDEREAVATRQVGLRVAHGSPVPVGRDRRSAWGQRASGDGHFLALNLSGAG